MFGLPPLPPFLPPPPFFFASIRAGGPLRACSDACSEALGAMRRAVQEQQHQQRRTAERSILLREIAEVSRRGGGRAPAACARFRPLTRCKRVAALGQSGLRG